MPKHYPLSALLLLLTLASCKKDEATRRELISAHPWQVSEHYMLVVPTGQQHSQYKATECHYDDQWTFRAGGPYLRDGMGTKCFQGDPATELGYWQLTEEDTKMSWKPDQGDSLVPYGIRPWTVESVDKEKLVLTQPGGVYAGQERREVLIFRKR